MTGPARSTPLVPERDDFIGREAELIELRRHWNDGRRLLTLLGPGGVGKTRLATHFAGSLAPEVPIWVCELAAATTQVQCIEALARSLGVSLPARTGLGQLGSMLGYALADRGRCLVVLDNFEQLVTEALPLVETWLDLAPQATLLVTSRERLRVRGEHCLDLGPMLESDAVDLFLARARAARSGFRAEESELSALIAKLEGLPLAIELCAARVRTLGLSELGERLGRRFETLVDRGARAPRQATLEATIDWSWQLLEPVARGVLRQCAVFRGSFDLDAAEQVISSPSPVVDQLEVLIDQSLLRVGVTGRYSLFESIREFCDARTEEGERQAAEERHAQVYLSRVASEVDEPNLVAVYERALARGSGDTAVAAALGLEPVLTTRGPVQRLVALLDDALALTVSNALGSRALVCRGLAKVTIGDFTGAIVDLAPALDDADARVAVHAAARSSVARAWMGQLDEARELLDFARRRLADASDPFLVGQVETASGILCTFEGRSSQAIAHHRAALDLFRQSGARRDEAIALENLGNRHLERGSAGEAEGYLTAALRMFQELGELRLEAHTLGDIGVLHAELGQLDDAESVLARALTLSRHVGDRHWEGILCGFLGDLEMERGRPQLAAERYGFAVQRLEELDNWRYAALFRAASAAAAGQLGDRPRALELLRSARRDLEAHGTPDDRHAVELWWALMHSGEERESAARRLAEVLDAYAKPGTEPPPNEVRLPRRLVERALSKSSGLRVAHDAAWFELGGTRVSLERRTSLRLVLHELVVAGAANEVRDVAALFRAGWPGQQVRAESAAHRVHVVIASLRKLGLEGVIVTRGDGYALGVPVERAPED